MGGGDCDADEMAQTRCWMTCAALISLPTCRKPHPLSVVSRRNAAAGNCHHPPGAAENKTSGVEISFFGGGSRLVL